MLALNYIAALKKKNPYKTAKCVLNKPRKGARKNHTLALKYFIVFQISYEF